MNNKKMITTAKNLDILANVGGKIFGAAGIVCFVIGILTLFLGGKMFTDLSTTLDLDFIKLHLTDTFYVDETYIKYYVVLSTLLGGCICFATYYTSTLLRKIFAPMKVGRPFEVGASGYLKKIGWIVLVVGFISQFVGMSSRTLLVQAYSIEKIFVSEAISGVEFIFTMNFNFVFIALAVFLLSYVFSYGQVLQQDSDETL